MGRRLLSLLLFVAGYLVLATLEPLVAAGPALTAFVADAPARAGTGGRSHLGKRGAAPGGGAATSSGTS
jgi:hypothetical protein